jgi:hypothetical protein
MNLYDLIRTMQILQTAVARGFHRWTGGFVRFDRAEAFAEKLQAIYHANPSGPVDLRLRRQGVARVKLVMCAVPAHLGFRWWLLASEGTGLVTTRETLHDALDRDHRIALGDFELVRLPRGARPAWTWRLPPAHFETLMAYAEAVATHRGPELAQAVIADMRRWPGFAGLRAQRKAIWLAMAAARSRAGRDDALAFPLHQPWPRRLGLQGHATALAVAVERMRTTVNTPGGKKP